jgi:hypothetical protein
MAPPVIRATRRCTTPCAQKLESMPGARHFHSIGKDSMSMKPCGRRDGGQRQTAPLSLIVRFCWSWTCKSDGQLRTDMARLI